jgi:hypothetical protein
MPRSTSAVVELLYAHRLHCSGFPVSALCAQSVLVDDQLFSIISTHLHYTRIGHSVVSCYYQGACTGAISIIGYTQVPLYKLSFLRGTWDP